jgi:hypothetical protein
MLYSIIIATADEIMCTTTGARFQKKKTEDYDQNFQLIVKVCKIDDSVLNSWHEEHLPIFFIKTLKQFSNQLELENNKHNQSLVVVVSFVVKRGPDVQIRN